MRTVTIYDWDNTLFPTSAMKEHKIREKEIPMYSTGFWEALEALEIAIIELLRKSLIYGRVIIISNESAEWLKSSRRKFFRYLHDFIESNGTIQFISLPDRYGGLLRLDMWNGTAFQKAIEEICTKRSRLNILVFGSDEHEMIAANGLKEYLPLSLMKTIRMYKTNQIDDFKLQVEHIRRQFRKFVDYKGKLNKIVRRTGDPTPQL